jgi:hypothetical protein
MKVLIMDSVVLLVTRAESAVLLWYICPAPFGVLRIKCEIDSVINRMNMITPRNRPYFHVRSDLMVPDSFLTLVKKNICHILLIDFSPTFTTIIGGDFRVQEKKFPANAES